MGCRKLADGIIGLGFHIRGIARKPSGWRLPVTNTVMGPPVFAPLLFGTSAYLGPMASYLRREGDVDLAMVGAECAAMVVGKNVYGLIAPEDRQRFKAFNGKICQYKRSEITFLVR